jgi:hypothetical protein
MKFLGERRSDSVPSPAAALVAPAAKFARDFWVNKQNQRVKTFTQRVNQLRLDKKWWRRSDRDVEPPEEEQSAVLQAKCNGHSLDLVLRKPP